MGPSVGLKRLVDRRSRQMVGVVTDGLLGYAEQHVKHLRASELGIDKPMHFRRRHPSSLLSQRTGELVQRL